MSVSAPVGPGELVAGKYRATRLLGAGGMGVVYEAFHERLAQTVAIKFMREDAARDHAAVERFVREARAAGRLKGPHVVRVLDAGDLEDGTPFIVMERLEGADVAALLAQVGPLSPAAAVEVVRQACACMAEAHAAGIVHRDLKPQNLFVTLDASGGPLVKVLDFGVSKLRDEGAPTVTATDTTMGSPAYMAPEQMRAARQADARSDVWSLGVILYQLLSGKLPFPSDSVPEVCAKVLNEPPMPLRDVAPGIPASLETVVIDCLVKDARARIPGARELTEALEPWRADGPVALSAAFTAWSAARRVADAGADTMPASGDVVRSPAPRPRSRGTTDPPHVATVEPPRRRWRWIAPPLAAAAALAGWLGTRSPGEARVAAMDAAPAPPAEPRVAQTVLAGSARVHFDSGQQAFSAGDYREAARHFAVAYALQPLPELRYNVAVAHERLGERTRAAELFTAYLAESPSALNRAEVEQRIAALRTPEPSPPDAGIAATPAVPPRRVAVSAPRPVDAGTTPAADAGVSHPPGLYEDFEKGNDAFRRGDYRAAAEHFLVCYATWRNSAFLYNAAVCYEKLGDKVRAAELFEIYLRDYPKSSDRFHVAHRLAILRGEVPPALPPTPAGAPDGGLRGPADTGGQIDGLVRPAAKR